MAAADASVRLSFRVDLSARLLAAKQPPAPAERAARAAALPFLRAHPASAYTSAVTVRGAAAAPLLDLHAARLAAGAASVLRVELPDPRGLALAGFSAGARAVRAALGDSRGCAAGPADQTGHMEVEIVLVLSHASVSGAADGTLAATAANIGQPGPKGANPAVWMHVLASPITVFAEDQRKHVVVEARGGPRRQALVKNSQWVADRRSLELARGQGVTETILMLANAEHEQGHSLLEGLVTNFYVIMRDGSIRTAGGDSILHGTVRSIVLDCVRKRDIPLVEEAPLVAQRRSFDGAFLTNALRMITPISCIHFPTIDDCDDLVLPMTPNAVRIMDELREAVVMRLAESSTPLE